MKRVVGRNVALLAHPASVTHRLEHIGDVLESLAVRPRVIFGPEHGYGGEAQDMIGVRDARDRRGAPVRSLYGESFDDLSPRAEDLAGLDVLLIDLQDVGARYYTFVWTALLALRACLRVGVEVVILDRPNPIGGDDDAIEGALQHSRFCSFVGLEPIPIRHGLTLGQIVALFAARDGCPREALTIVSSRGLDRHAHASAWGAPFVMPSPNMPTYETALVYPGACLIEGTNLSEGRGVTRPFEIVGAPFLDGVRLARDLARLGLPGLVARPLTFRPTFHKHAGTVCGGVQIHPVDVHAFRPVATYFALLALAHAQAPDDFRFRTERYEFVDDVPAIDLLTGSALFRQRIEASADARDVAELALASSAELDCVRDARETVRQFAV